MYIKNFDSCLQPYIVLKIDKINYKLSICFVYILILMKISSWIELLLKGSSNHVNRSFGKYASWIGVLLKFIVNSFVFNPFEWFPLSILKLRSSSRFWNKWSNPIKNSFGGTKEGTVCDRGKYDLLKFNGYSYEFNTLKWFLETREGGVWDVILDWLTIEEEGGWTSWACRWLTLCFCKRNKKMKAIRID